MSESAPLGIFGGTFDPVHSGHLRLAEEAIDRLGLSGVRWIPAGQPVLRGAPRADPRARLDMVRLAIADNPRFELDPAETDAKTPSYTVTTLERLRQTDVCGAKRPLVLLMGNDVFASLTGWHRWERLFELTHIAVAHRPGYPLDPERLPAELATALHRRRYRDPAQLGLSPAGGILPFTITPLDISATRIRSLLPKGESPRYLTPDSVLAYIHQHRLYLEN